MCVACQFGKAHHRPQKCDTGHIDTSHTTLGAGISSDGMEAGMPGRTAAAKGLPSMARFRYCCFWVDHYSRFVCVTFHTMKAAAETIKSKWEFEGFA
jgi:hypothetical protein